MNPGSEIALDAGCRCPVIDNHYGKGRPDGSFWISGECPLHGQGKPLPPDQTVRFNPDGTETVINPEDHEKMQAM